MQEYKIKNSNGEYSCGDIGISSDEWYKLLQDNKSKPYIETLLCFLREPEHKCYCSQLAKEYGKTAAQYFNSQIAQFSQWVEKKLGRIVDEKWVYGVVSMPSNVFATTGTNVSVIFFDKSAQADKVILIDASKLGEEYKEGNNQKRRLRDFEVDKIVNTFQDKESVDDFSVAVTYDEIKEKGYSLSAGQYFDIKIDYVDITEEEFNRRITSYKATLQEQFAESHRLEEEIIKQLGSLSFNANAGKE